MKKKKVILSYDYELFFGDRSGTVQKSLIEPTNQLLDAMESVGFKGNFFIDWQMLKYLSLEKDDRCKLDNAAIVSQLKDMVRRGHRIELHIHPHWVDAKYNGDGTWNFDEFRHYSLNSFTKDEITEMFVEGTNLLESIAREIEPNYKIIAFRAGGWAVQPFDILAEGFIKAGIKIDSSVMPGLHSELENSYFDFRNAPLSQLGYYHFDMDVVTEKKTGQFLEVPISSTKHKMVNRFINFFYRILGDTYECYTDGSHFRRQEGGHSSYTNSMIPYTISSIKPFNQLFYIARSKQELVCYIDHPKDYSNYTINGIHAISKLTESITYKDLIYV